MKVIPKILIIGKESKLLQDALPLYGYKIEIAYDGLQALNLLMNNNKKYDLVILDNIVPKIDCWQILQIIRSNSCFENILIILLTDINNNEKEISSLKLGVDDYITKPYKIPFLLAHIEVLLRRSKVKQQTPLSLDIKIHQKTNGTESTITQLTTKEKKVLKYVLEGASNNEIAEKLSIKEVTVKARLTKIFKKLNVTNRMQAVILALKLNLLDL